MQLLSSLRKWLTGHTQFQRTMAPKPTTRFRPQLELLDDRIVPSTLTVTNNLDDGSAGSLRGEIADAQNGDTIVFDTSLSGQTINLYGNSPDGELVINKNLAIQGLSAPLLPVTISGGGSSRVFEVDGAKTVVSLSNLNITLGAGNDYYNPVSGGAPNGQGGAIWNGGTLTVNACNLSNNSAISTVGLGGAIYNAGTLTVINSVLDNNTVYGYDFDHPYGGNGGAIYNTGTLTVNNSTLDNNIAQYGAWGGGYGGGIFNAYKATATITGSTLSGNSATYNSGGYIIADGGIYNDGSVVNNSVYDLYNLGVVKISSDSVVG
jgi:hypothetical protein